MGTRAFISRQQFCTSGIYITMDGYPDSIEQQLRRTGKRGERRSLEDMIQQAGSCGEGFGGRDCSGEHTLEAFHSIGWGMHPEWHYYLGGDGKPRATYVYQGGPILFGEDHSFAGWKFSVWPQYRAQWSAERDDQQSADYEETSGDTGGQFYHHKPRYGGSTTACGVPEGRAVFGKRAGRAAGLDTLCPRCMVAREAEEKAEAERERLARERRAAQASVWGS